MRSTIFSILVLLAASSCTKKESQPAQQATQQPVLPTLPTPVDVTDRDGGVPAAPLPPLPPAERAAPDACKKACENFARLQKQAAEELGKIKVHEFEEMMELTIKQNDVDIERIKMEMESPPAPFDEGLLKNPKLTASGRKQLRETYEMGLKELRRQRVDALEKAHAAKAELKQKFEFIKKKIVGDADKAGQEASTQCNADCEGGRKSIKEAQCLIDAKLPVDITACRAP